jgi:hypothetical protein
LYNCSANSSKGHFAFLLERCLSLHCILGQNILRALGFCGGVFGGFMSLGSLGVFFFVFCFLSILVSFLYTPYMLRGV